MISNLDAGKLDLILTFSNFLEVLNNPELYSSYVKEAKATLIELKEALKAKAKVDEADKYYKETMDKIQEERDDLIRSKASHERTFNDTRAELNQRQSDLDKMEVTLKEFEITLQKKDKAIGNRELAAQRYEGTLSGKESEVSRRFQELATQEDELRKKSEQIKTLIG